MSEMITVRQALRNAMHDAMAADEAVFLMGQEVAEYQGAYKVSQGLLESFGPRRVIDTPITEAGCAGLGVGAAWLGLRPIIEFMTFNFSMQAIDQIINSAAKTYYMSGGQIHCPIVFRGPNGAAARVAAQHSQCFASWYMHCPGLKVLAPYDAASAYDLLRAAIEDPDPVVFLENEIMYNRSFPDIKDRQRAVIGQAAVVRQGTDVTVATFSRMVEVALQAAEGLAGEGISVEVLDMRTLRPFDREALARSVTQTHRFMALEEGWPTSGVGAEWMACVTEDVFDELDAPPARLCGLDIPMPYAVNLEAEATPGVTRVIDEIRKMVGGEV